MLEKHIDDYLNVDGNRELSDAWTGFTRFIVLNEKQTWSGERLTRKQTTSRPDKLWPEMWKHMSEASKQKEEEVEEEDRIVAKIKADGDEPDINCLDKFLIREPSDCVEHPGDTQGNYKET